MTNQEKELLANFKVEELEERLEMGHWGCGSSGQSCPDVPNHPQNQ